MLQFLRNYSLRQSIIKSLCLLEPDFRKIRDPRDGAVYPLPDVLIEIIKALISGARSLKDIEHKQQVENFFQLKCCDSFFGKLLSQIPETEVKHFQEILWQQYIAYTKRNLTSFCLSNGQAIRVMHFDGTYFLGHYFTYGVSGGAVKPIVGIKVSSNMGQELSTTKKLVEEIRQFNAQLQIEPSQTINTFDGKYFCYKFLKEIHKKKEGFLVRIRKDDARDLEIIEFLNTFLNNESSYMQEGVRSEERIDYVRKIKYIVSWTWDKPPKLNFPIIIAYIRKQPIITSKAKQGDDEIDDRELYVISNLTRLSPEDIYELTTSHWEVETAFRDLKRQFVSSKTWMKHPLAALIWAFLIAIAYDIVIFFSYKFHCKINEKSRKSLQNIRDILERMLSSMRRTLKKILYGEAEATETINSPSLSPAGL